MEADEAMALLSTIARADILELFDENGDMLPVHLWPASIRLAVKTVRCSRSGVSITLHDALRACELIATAAGRLKPSAEHRQPFDYAAYLVPLD